MSMRFELKYRRVDRDFPHKYENLMEKAQECMDKGAYNEFVFYQLWRDMGDLIKYVSDVQAEVADDYKHYQENLALQGQRMDELFKQYQEAVVDKRNYRKALQILSEKVEGESK